MGQSKGILIAAVALFVGTASWGAVSEAYAQAGQTLDLSGKLNLDRILACGFVTTKPVSYMGTIVGSQDASNNLSEGDLVYIKLEPGIQAKAGDRLVISRFSKEIEHPVSKKILGHALFFPGKAVILDGKGPIVPAMIDKSFATVRHGDMVMASLPSAPVVVPVRMQEGLKGVVVAAAEEEVSISEREVVYIDRGSFDGVIVGDLFSIYSMPYYTQETLDSQDKLPSFKSGEGVVIYVTPQTSTLLVRHSKDVIYVGDTIVSGKGK